MSEADEFCECGTEVDQIHCQVCGAKVCSLHDYNATIDMQQQRIQELEQEVERLKEERCNTITQFVYRVERRAEQTMLATGKLEGAHYNAMRALSAEEKEEVKP